MDDTDQEVGRKMITLKMLKFSPILSQKPLTVSVVHNFLFDCYFNFVCFIFTNVC